MLDIVREGLFILVMVALLVFFLKVVFNLDRKRNS